MSSVGKELERLKFVAQHVEPAYLNKESVHDRFTASSGAISAWVTKASKGGGGKVGLSFIEVEGQAEAANEVTYDITDPIAQAMLLRASVEASQMLRPLDEANMLEYVLVSGPSCLRHPSLPEARWHTEACAPTDELEEQRADAELFHKPFDPHAMVWLLMVQLSEGRRAAAVVDRKWVNDRVVPRFFHRIWTTFGVLQNRIGDVPLLAPIFSFVEYPAQPQP
jgi:hypothetical protein